MTTRMYLSDEEEQLVLAYRAMGDDQRGQLERSLGLLVGWRAWADDSDETIRRAGDRARGPSPDEHHHVLSLDGQPSEAPSPQPPLTPAARWAGVIGRPHYWSRAGTARLKRLRDLTIGDLELADMLLPSLEAGAGLDTMAQSKALGELLEDRANDCTNPRLIVDAFMAMMRPLDDAELWQGLTALRDGAELPPARVAPDPADGERAALLAQVRGAAMALEGWELGAWMQGMASVPGDSESVFKAAAILGGWTPQAKARGRRGGPARLKLQGTAAGGSGT